MADKSADEYFGKMADLQTEIGREMHRLLTEDNADWDQTRLHVEHHGPEDFEWGFMYRKNEGPIQSLLLGEPLESLTEKYFSLVSEAAKDQVKRVRFELNTDLKFHIEMWYTPTKGLPGWTWQEEQE